MHPDFPTDMISCILLPFWIVPHPMILAGHIQGGTTGIADADIAQTIKTAVENHVEG